MKSTISKKSLKSAPTPKIEVTTKPESKKKEEPEILKSGVAPSLNGKASLSYQVGRTESNEPQLRIVANSNAGAFRTDWTEVKAIRAVLDRAPRNETITSDVLRQLYRGGSANQSGFIFSVLLREGLVRRSTKEKRRYERVEPEVFDAAVKALMEGKGASANADAKASKAKGKKAVATKPKNDKKSSKLS